MDCKLGLKRTHDRPQNHYITPEQHAFIAQKLRAGRFGNVSEVMRAALRLLQEYEAGFQAHLDARVNPPHDR